jgi:hypothetical protein
MEREKSTATEVKEAAGAEQPVKRLLCIGKIRRGVKTMVIAFPRQGGNARDTVSPGSEND